MRPPGWPEGVADPDDPALDETAVRWLWDVVAVPREPGSVWGLHPRALAFRAACDLDGRLQGTRAAYAQARVALADVDVELAEVLTRLEGEAAQLQRQRREVDLVAEALDGRRWRARL